MTKPDKEKTTDKRLKQGTPPKTKLVTDKDLASVKDNPQLLHQLKSKYKKAKGDESKIKGSFEVVIKKYLKMD